MSCALLVSHEPHHPFSSLEIAFISRMGKATVGRGVSPKDLWAALEEARAGGKRARSWNRRMSNLWGRRGQRLRLGRRSQSWWAG